jgi:hypothetical protein
MDSYFSPIFQPLPDGRIFVQAGSPDTGRRCSKVFADIAALEPYVSRAFEFTPPQIMAWRQRLADGGAAQLGCTGATPLVSESTIQALGLT